MRQRHLVLAVVGGFASLLVVFGAGWAPGQTGRPAPPRRLAPGVLTVIPAHPEEQDTAAGPRELHGLLRRADQLQWDPRTFASSDTVRAKAQEVFFRRSVWQLEFGFKPLRTIRAEVPTPDGGRQSAVVWYLLYYVRNPGQHLQPVAADDPGSSNGVYRIATTDRPVRFFPTFLLQGHDEPAVYRERILPQIAQQIARREAPDRPVHDSVSISQQDLPVSEDAEQGRVWGVATWTDVDPATDFLSVLVQGLTNAYQWELDAEGQKQYQFRSLQLYFWRPGDEIRAEEDRIRYGVPFLEDPEEQSHVLEIFSLPMRLDHQWVYR